MNLNRPRPKRRRCCARQGIDLPLPKDQLRQLNPFAVIVRYQDIEITLTGINTGAEMMERVHTWVERQIYE